MEKYCITKNIWQEIWLPFVQLKPGPTAWCNMIIWPDKPINSHVIEGVLMGLIMAVPSQGFSTTIFPIEIMANEGLPGDST